MDQLLRHPKARGTLVWGETLTCAIVLGVWVASAWFHASWGTSRRAVNLGAGRVSLTFLDAGSPIGMAPGWRAGRIPAHFDWWFEGGSFWGKHTVAVPLWCLLIITLPPTAAAWRARVIARHRARRAQCPHCGYDLRGLAACPECGRAAVASLGASGA